MGNLSDYSFISGKYWVYAELIDGSEIYRDKMCLENLNTLNILKDPKPPEEATMCLELETKKRRYPLYTLLISLPCTSPQLKVNHSVGCSQTGSQK